MSKSYQTLVKNIINTSNNIFTFLIIMSSISLGTAFYIEAVLNIPPCILCNYQRCIYLAILLVSLLALKKHKIRYHLLIIIILLFCVQLILAAYHNGIELGLFDGLNQCINQTDFNELDVDKLREMILATDVVSCKKPTYIVGIVTLSQINLIFTLIMLIVTVCTGIKCYKIKNT